MTSQGRVAHNFPKYLKSDLALSPEPKQDRIKSSILEIRLLGSATKSPRVPGSICLWRKLTVRAISEAGSDHPALRLQGTQEVPPCSF